MLDLKTLILTVFFVSLGSFFMYGAARQHRKRTFLRNNGLQAEGTVVRLEADKNPKSKALFPVVRFTTLTHGTITLRYNLGNYPAGFQLGQRVPLLYDPLAPERFVIVTEASDWAIITLGLLGVFFTGLGLYNGIKSYL